MHLRLIALPRLAGILLAGFQAWALLCREAQSHEFWISPEHGRVETGQTIIGDQKVGAWMSGQSYPYLTNRFQSFTRTVRGQTQPVNSRDGDIPALRYDAKEPGLHVVAHHTIAFRVTYDDWDLFEKYLRQEGYQDLITEHQARGLPHQGFAERYTRCSKLLVQAGPIAAEDHDVNTGMPIEIVADGNPYAPGLTTLPVTLYWQGKPLAGRQIDIYHDAGTVSLKTVITDADGRAAVPLEGPGEYLINAVRLDPIDRPPVVWESHWAALSFKLE